MRSTRDCESIANLLGLRRFLRSNETTALRSTGVARIPRYYVSLSDISDDQALRVHSRSGLFTHKTAQNSPLLRSASADSLSPSPLLLLPTGSTFTNRELRPLKIIVFYGTRQKLPD